jgi:hypothetical protein
MKIERVIKTGVILMKDGKAWLGADTRYESAEDGWGDATLAEPSDPKFCKKPYDLSSPPGHLIDEMNKGKLVSVRKTVSIEILGDA